MQHEDVVIVGAGLSGIGAACHLQTRCPGKHYLILEGRERMGGTWDLFRYPGVRSDPAMYTPGYCFRPWPSRRAMCNAALRALPSRVKRAPWRLHRNYLRDLLSLKFGTIRDAQMVFSNPRVAAST